jgi:hypothetical protein
VIIHFGPASEYLYTSDPKSLYAFGQQIGLSPLYVGLLPATSNNQLRQVVALYDREIRNALEDTNSEPPPPPLAILSAFNEGDVIKEVVEDLIKEGCEVVVLDNWSTDGTWETLRSLQNAISEHLTIERFPTKPAVESSWTDILSRKEEIALSHGGRWIIHTDADELRRSPFPGVDLARAMHAARITGATRLEFTILNFCPVDASPYIPGNLENAFKYFQFGSHPSYFQQCKAWFQGSERVNLRESGGHRADFANAVDFRYKFWLKHFPVRSMSHGRIKIHRDRVQRWSKAEQESGWHVHYQEIAQESSFVWPAEQLHEYHRDTFHKNYGLTIMTNIAERNKPSVAVQPFLWRTRAIDERHELTTARLDEAERQIKDASSQIAQRAEFITEVEERIKNVSLQMAERAELLAQAESRIKELTMELNSLYNSSSWRVTAPIRAMKGRFTSCIYGLVKKTVRAAKKQ